MILRNMVSQKMELGLSFFLPTRDHPQTNGLVERGRLTSYESIRESYGASYDYQNWPKYLHSVLWADRISVRRTTGYHPPFLYETDVWAKLCLLTYGT